MKKMLLAVVLAVAVAFVGECQADPTTTTYNSEASFVSALKLGYDLYDFGDLPSTPPNHYLQVDLGSSWAHSGNGYSYTITAPPADLLKPYGFNAVSADYWSGVETLTVNFTSGNVTAVGGDIFTTFRWGIANNNGFANGILDVSLNDGTTVSIMSPTNGTGLFLSAPFAGFTSPGHTITSLTITEELPPSYGGVTLGHLYVGTAVPEPSTWSLLALGAVALLGGSRMRRRSSRSVEMRKS